MHCKTNGFPSNLWWHGQSLHSLQSLQSLLSVQPLQSLRCCSRCSRCSRCCRCGRCSRCSCSRFDNVVADGSDRRFDLIGRVNKTPAIYIIVLPTMKNPVVHFFLWTDSIFHIIRARTRCRVKHNRLNNGLFVSVCAHFVCRLCRRCSCCSRQKKVDGPT